MFSIIYTTSFEKSYLRILCYLKFRNCKRFTKNISDFAAKFARLVKEC